MADASPKFLQRFPQRIIASYLGITQESLSGFDTIIIVRSLKLISVSCATGILLAGLLKNNQIGKI